MTRFAIAILLMLGFALGQVREDQQAWIRVDKKGCAKLEVWAASDTYFIGPDPEHMKAINLHARWDKSCERIEIVRK